MLYPELRWLHDEGAQLVEVVPAVDGSRVATRPCGVLWRFEFLGAYDGVRTGGMLQRRFWPTAPTYFKIDVFRA